MRAALLVAGRQLRAYARTATGPGVVAAFAATASLLFFDRAFFDAGAPSLATLFAGPTPLLLALVAPAFAATALVEERARGTLDLVLTAPVSTRQLVVGKWLAGLGLWAACLVSTAPVAMAVDWLGGLDPGAAVAGYLGALLLGGLLLAVALAAAARARSPVNGALAGALACGALVALGALARGRDLGALAYHAAPTSQLAPFARGVVPVSALIYFALATTAGLELASARVDRPRSTRVGFVRGLAAAGTAAALALIAAAVAPGRVDLTRAGSESLTPASRALAARADDIDVTAYFGRVPTAQRPARAAVERLLDRYAAASRGRLAWRAADPFDESPQARRDLTARGVRPLLWSTTTDGVPQQTPVYFHVEFRRGERSVVWQPAGRLDLAGLEYQLSSRLRGLVAGRARVAVTTGFGSPALPAALLDFLASEYDATAVALDDGAPDLDAYELVIVNGPRSPVGEAALAALERYRAAGKPLLLLVRGMSLQRQRPVEGGPPGATQPPLLVPVRDGLEPLLDRLGVGVERAAVIDASDNVPGAVPVDGQAVLARPLFPATVPAPGAPFALPRRVPAPMAAPLRPGDAAIPLLVSSPTAGLRTELLPITRRATFDVDSPERGPFALAVAIDGPPGRAVVFGSADLVGDPLMSLAMNQPAFAELLVCRDAVLAAIAWLLGREPLTEAREKSAIAPMAPVTRTERAALAYGTSAGTALAVGLLWLAARWWRRRQRTRQRF